MQATREGSGLPSLLVVVTGRGPQRSAYQAAMQQLDLQRVAFRTLWLEPEDYPRLLGACDAGVCLHTSSSGLDLPMKVAHMPDALWHAWQTLPSRLVSASGRMHA